MNRERTRNRKGESVRERRERKSESVQTYKNTGHFDREGGQKAFILEGENPLTIIHWSIF